MNSNPVMPRTVNLNLKHGVLVTENGHSFRHKLNSIVTVQVCLGQVRYVLVQLTLNLLIF